MNKQLTSLSHFRYILLYLRLMTR